MKMLAAFATDRVNDNHGHGTGLSWPRRKDKPSLPEILSAAGLFGH